MNYIIKDKNGNIINRVTGSKDFVQSILQDGETFCEDIYTGEDFPRVPTSEEKIAALEARAKAAEDAILALMG